MRSVGEHAERLLNTRSQCEEVKDYGERSKLTLTVCPVVRSIRMLRGMHATMPPTKCLHPSLHNSNYDPPRGAWGLL